MKTMKDMFDAVNELPVDSYGVYKNDGRELIHVYNTGRQFNVHGYNGDPIWNVIRNDGSVNIVPVIDGASQWGWGREFLLEEDCEVVPFAVWNALQVAGIM